MNTGIDLEQEVIAELEKGKKISAIKVLRELRGIGLKDAKELVEEYASVNNLNSGSSSASTPGSGLKVILIAVVIIAGYWIYSQSL